jgi:polyisoprenoid-binding protein YceI
VEKHLFALLIAFALAAPGCAPAPDSSAQATTGDASPAAVDLPSEAPATVDGSPDAPAAAAGKIIELSPSNTKIEFIGTKPEGKHNGGFKTFAGQLALAADNQTPAQISVEIQTDSLYSDVEKLTKHLKNSDFFEVNAYPTSRFVSTSIARKAVGQATHEVIGDLTLRGVTKSITFPIRVTGSDELTLLSEFKFNRSDFGMTYGQGKVDDAVQVTVTVEAPLK